jgi:hypothetical protein
MADSGGLLFRYDRHSDCRSSEMEVSVPTPTRNRHLYELAKRGAEVQFRELLHELKLLVNLFPHLRDSFDKDELPINFIMATGSGAVTKTRRRGRMSPAARRAASARMKKYWAARRREKQE